MFITKIFDRGIIDTIKNSKVNRESVKANDPLKKRAWGKNRKFSKEEKNN